MLSNYIHYKAWDEKNLSILNFNGATVEVGEQISIFQSTLNRPCDYLSIQGVKLIHISKWDPLVTSTFELHWTENLVLWYQNDIIHGIGPVVI